MNHEESNIQKHCVQYFRLAYPQYAGVFFSVPNGGHRDLRVAHNMKMEGTLAGVADLLLLVPRGGYNCLAIEMKTPKGRQSEQQKQFEYNLTTNGGKYVICRSYDEFKYIVDDYLK